MAKSYVAQQKTERDNPVVMYGLSENGCEWDNISGIFSLISWRARCKKLAMLGLGSCKAA